MKSLFSILIILLIVSTACSKDEEDTRLSSFQTPVVTGFYVRDGNGWVIQTIGVPNVKLGNTSNDITSAYLVLLYPNPANERCSISIHSPSGDEIKKVWLTRANPGEQLYNSFRMLNMSIMSLGGYPLFQEETTGTNLSLDLSKLESGYYRLYVKINEILLYDNLVIDKNSELR
jgi:hypothetical protein